MGTLSVGSSHLLWRAPWITLGALFGLLLIAAAACERSVEDLGDVEISLVLQAESMLRDFDLAYGEEDQVRYAEKFGDLQRDLILRTDPQGGPPRFDSLQVYPLVIAPMVSAVGLRGAAITNAILLVFAAIAAVHRLGKRLGSVTPLFVALLVFASVTYRSVFVVDPAIMLFSFAVLAMSLTFRFEEPGSHDIGEMYREAPTSLPVGSNWLCIGLLIGLTIAFHPLYSVLLLPPAVSVPEGHRRAGLIALAVGAALALILVRPELGGGLVPAQLDAGLFSWNMLYLFVGRNVGLLPYFLPLVLTLGMTQGGEGRTTLWVSALLGSVLFVILMPYDFYGGPAAVGNRWVLPLTAALWFLPTRPFPRYWLGVTALFAAPLMIPTWMAPSVDLVTPNEIYRHASGRLHSWLPPETSQEPIPNGGEVMGRGLWVRSLSGTAQPTSAGRWEVEGNEDIQLLVASPTPLASVYLQFGPQAEPELELRGGTLGNMVLAPDGAVGFRVDSLRRRALHPMWWSREKHSVYLLRMRMPQDQPTIQTLTIRAFAQDIGGQQS